MQWLATGEASIPDGTDWMSDRELSRLARLRFTKPRTEYLLRRWSAKRAVAAALGRSLERETAARIELLNHPSGAPYVLVDAAPAGIDVSLTDRAGWAVVLVGEPGSFRSGTIGVDLELVEPRSAGFVADFLTPVEQSYVASRGACGEPGWDVAANLLWSAKEAVLKVQRVGLRADTRTVEVWVDHRAGPDGWAALTATGADGTAYPGWWRRDGRFLLTIAHREPQQPPWPLPGSEDLATAVPIHSWVANPLVQGASGDSH
ncbi:MAG: 4'-phosphopantetheinyl transferase superfamily protein [Dermatophilaceae bacterium]